MSSTDSSGQFGEDTASLSTEWTSEGFRSASERVSQPPSSAVSTRPSSRMSLIDEDDKETYSKTVHDEERDEVDRKPSPDKKEARVQPRLIYGHAEQSNVVRQGAKASDGDAGSKGESVGARKRKPPAKAAGESLKKKPKSVAVGPMDFYLRSRNEDLRVSHKVGQIESNVLCSVGKSAEKVPSGKEDLEEAIESSGDSSESSGEAEYCEQDTEGSSDDDCMHESDESHTQNFTSHEQVTGRPRGTSRSAQHAQKMKDARLAGNQKVNPKLYGKFETACLQYDPNALFNSDDWTVRCSKCGFWMPTKSLYSPTFFIKHAKSCKGGTINKYLSGSGFLETARVTVTCSGLTAVIDPRISTYLQRPSALGGGGRSKKSIALERYGKIYGKLSARKKKEVDRLNEAGWLWVVKPQQHAVFHVSCEITLEVPRALENRDNACDTCTSLQKEKKFRNALDIPAPDPENMKHANKRYRQEELGLKFMQITGVKELVNSQVRTFNSIYMLREPKTRFDCIGQVCSNGNKLC